MRYVFCKWAYTAGYINIISFENSCHINGFCDQSLIFHQLDGSNSIRPPFTSHEELCSLIIIWFCSTILITIFIIEIFYCLIYLLLSYLSFIAYLSLCRCLDYWVAHRLGELYSCLSGVSVFVLFP